MLADQANLLARSGDEATAAERYARAAGGATNEAERRYLAHQARRLTGA